MSAGHTPGPCPFCGGAAFSQSPHLGCSQWTVICDDCGARGPGSGPTDADEAKAVSLWNDRHHDSELSAAKGYLMNAKIDLETGCPKATAIQTIAGGIARIDAALARGDAARRHLTPSLMRAR